MTRPVQTPEGLFAARVASDPSRPFLTFYDDASGERVELSARSLANWVAKTHYYLLDELGLGRGDKAFVTLPAHWLAAPILLGCWSAGLEVRSTATDARVAFGDAPSLQAADLADAEDVLAVSLLSMGRSGTPPEPMADYAAAVRPQPDSWAGVRAQAGPTDPALDGESRASLVARAVIGAQSLGLEHSGRLLWTRPWTGPDEWVASIVAALAVGASLVLVRNADPAATPAKAASERATVTV